MNGYCQLESSDMECDAEGIPKEKPKPRKEYTKSDQDREVKHNMSLKENTTDIIDSTYRLYASNNDLNFSVFIAIMKVVLIKGGFTAFKCHHFDGFSTPISVVQYN
ncbi:hypothetical protein BY458DRAFT_491186 [Sporodiniella umbellata]|nr:hypothetical protein BY458DRAFT_491186 [Sporodiniella umbellata]